MTDILTRDPNDSDEFPLRIGEERTVILRRDTTREVTQNLGHEIAGLPPRRRPAADETVTQMRLIEPALGLNHHDMAIRSVIEMDETVIYCDPDWPDRVDGELEGPQKPPPPLPPIPPKYDMADAQPLWPLERVAGAAETERLSLLGSVAGLDGELRPAAGPLPVAAILQRPPLGWWARLTYRGQHRAGGR